MPRKPIDENNSADVKARYRAWLWSTVAVIVTLVAVSLSPVGGNLEFYSEWARCGQKPVQTQSTEGRAWYEESPTFQLMFRNKSWYCTPIEAERAGYSASDTSYEFPYLKAAGEPNPYLPK